MISRNMNHEATHQKTHPLRLPFAMRHHGLPTANHCSGSNQPVECMSTRTALFLDLAIIRLAGNAWKRYHPFLDGVGDEFARLHGEVR